MQIIYKLLLSVLFAAYAQADVGYECKSADGFPPTLTLEIKSAMWARLTVGNKKSGYLPCVVRIYSMDQDRVKFENEINDYSAMARAKECNLAYQNYGGDFTWLKVHKSMMLENTAPRLGNASTKNNSILTNYTCSRFR